MLPGLAAPPDAALVDCTALLEARLNAAGGPEVLARLASEGLLACDEDGQASRWQPAGRNLQAAVLRLAEDAREAEAAAVDAPTEADATPAALETYTGLLRSTLGAYSTTAAEDRATLEGGGADAMAPRTKLALQFRLTQKTLLGDALAAAERGGASGMSDAARLLARPGESDLGGDDAFDFSLTDLKPL